MPKYRLQISYDGTNYAGWQVQPNGTSIQAVIQAAISQITQAKSGVTGSGRTDAGVHARGQVAHFTTDSDLDLHRFSHSLNRILPPDIRILSIDQVADDFHARYSAKIKTYTYYLTLDRVQLPFDRLYALHIPHEIDIEAMKAAALPLIGTHDFTSFANSPTEGSVAKDPVRTLQCIDFHPTPTGMAIELTSTGFLYKMVRNIIGTLLDAAKGKPLNTTDILEARDRRLAGQAAPPHGLFLTSVRYGASD